jgi:hypothetical protein
MTADRTHPDLLRRFVPTPYVFGGRDGSNNIFIESNDLEIALSVRDSGVLQRQGAKDGGLFCKIIRDATCSKDGSGMVVVSDGVLRVLYRGRGTILIHDWERSELLGFVSSNVKGRDLVSSIFPALFAPQNAESASSVAFTKK